jgi:glycosyltransferase involved in cell wall biosynthesis
MRPPAAPVTSIDVVVASLRRPVLLRRCLDGLLAQTRLPDRIVVAARYDDEETRRVATEDTSGLVHLAVVPRPGVVAAMRAGTAATTADAVAYTDDDAVPRPEWLARILTHFDTPDVGGVGGRDVIPGQEGPLREVVGHLPPNGRLVGNHHLGTGAPRDVAVLKGVNMAWRAGALAFPDPDVLRGKGMQLHFEILMAEWARNEGWRLVYDPSITVHHDGAPRPDDSRDRPSPETVRNEAYNRLFALTALDPAHRPLRVATALLAGGKDNPGIARAAAALVKRERAVLRRFGPSLAGHVAAARDVRNARNVMTPALDLRAI